MDPAGTPASTTGPVSRPPTTTGLSQGPMGRAGPTPPPNDLVPLTGGGTAYFGRVFPVVWTAAAGMLTTAAWLGLLGDGPTPGPVKWAMLTIWAAVSALIIRYFGSLKHVWRRGDELVVGDPRRGLRIHLSEVREIKETRFQQIKVITLKLRRPTELGTSISFVPRGAGAFFFPMMGSSVAERLRERHQEIMAEQHRMVGKG